MTNYHQCVSCTKTSAQENCVVKTDGGLICPHCLEAVEFAFSVCTVDSPEPSLGFCGRCDELEDELHLVDGDWICDKCKATVTKSTKLSTQGYWCRATNEQIDPQDVEPYGHPKHGWIDVCPCHHLELVREKPVPREPDTKLLREELRDLEKGCTDHWEMIKSHVFVTLLFFAVIGVLIGKAVCSQ